MRVLNHVSANNSEKTDKHHLENFISKVNMFLDSSWKIISTTSEGMIYVPQGNKASRRKLH